MKKIGILFLFLFVKVAFADALITKVINLNYKSAAQIISLVQPLLASGEQVTGSGQTIIVKVSPTTLTQIRTILHSVDVPPVSFVVSIFQGPANWLDSQNDDMVISSTPSKVNQQKSQSVTVMNGESAFVSTGEQIPIVSSVGVGLWNTGISYQQQQTQKGLYVQPTLQGDQVKLMVKRVRSQENSQLQNSSQFEDQNIMTTVMVPLDQWTSLGSTEGASTQAKNTQVFTAGNQFMDSATLYIKVSKTGGS